MLVPNVFQLDTFIFYNMIILQVIIEVDLYVAFVHPFQEFLVKLVTASGKLFLNINCPKLL